MTSTQNWQASVSSSSRLQVLSELKTEDYKISKYVLDIRGPLIRKTFTRLRIDLNVLQEYMGGGGGSVEVVSKNIISPGL